MKSFPSGLSSFVAAAVLAALLLAPVAAAADGSISGTVTADATDTPLDDVFVCAYRAADEVWEEEPENCDATNSAGDYRIGFLSPDLYKVRFWPDRAFASQYYSDAYSWAEATDVAVASGVEVDGVDAALAAGGRIEGTVTDSVDGLPISSIEVHVWDRGNPDSFGQATTDGDGDFAVAGLPAGEYTVEFWAAFTRDYANEFYDDSQLLAGATPVPLALGETATDIDAALDPGGHISGRVTDTSGTPLRWILVCAFRDELADYWRCTGTDEHGEYTLQGLGSGEYYVQFSGDWEREEFGEEDAYREQYYDGRATLAEADPIAMAPGADIRGVDARLVNRIALVGGGEVVTEPLGDPFPSFVLPPADLASRPPTLAAPPKGRKCPKGKARRKVKGELRCVRRKQSKRRGGGDGQKRGAKTVR